MKNVKKIIKGDLRIERTRENLWKAMVELIDERGYFAFSVKDITDRAHVNRTTFYYHYEDKDDFFRQGSVDICDSLRERLRDIPVGDMRSAIAWTQYLERMFSCLAEDRDTLRILIGPKSNPEFRRIIDDKVSAFLIAERLGMWISPAAMQFDPVLSDLYACAATSLLTSLAYWWVNYPKPISSMRIAKIYATLIVGGFRGLFMPSE
jgi:AcrR family transcriptional regulator